jgi:hypothetical protein
MVHGRLHFSLSRFPRVFSLRTTRPHCGETGVARRQKVENAEKCNVHHTGGVSLSSPDALALAAVRVVTQKGRARSGRTQDSLDRAALLLAVAFRIPLPASAPRQGSQQRGCASPPLDNPPCCPRAETTRGEWGSAAEAGVRAHMFWVSPLLARIMFA